MTMLSRDAVAAEKKIECFCLDPDDPIVYVGTVGGTLAAYSTVDFNPLFEVTAHAGIIAAVVYQRSRGLIACLSADNTVSIWKSERGAAPIFKCRIPLWNFQPSNDQRAIADFQSESQALALHPDLPRIATRSGNGALLEIDFDDFGAYRYLYCVRLFEAADLTCVQYVPGSTALLAGSISGQLGLVLEGKVVDNVATGGSNIHWIEPIGGGEFLLASDSRQVIRVDLYALDSPVIGEKFCRDDLEHVALSHDGSVAYAGSFDRKVYEIDPETCKPRGIVFNAPFKCRWVRSLPDDPKRLVVQTRDGGLHLFDLRCKRPIRSVRETPSAIWTADRRDEHTLYLAGEPDSLITLNHRTGRTSAVSIAHISQGEGAYSKRLVALGGGQGCLLGRTDGTVVRFAGDVITGSISLGAAVRDICEGADETAFVAMEDGRVVKIDLKRMTVCAAFVSPLDEPIWSLAFNGQSILAIAERGGSLRMLSACTLEAISEHSHMTRPKRMKWRDADNLVFGWSDELRAFNLKEGREILIVDSVGNTIEDFIFQPEFDYVVFISYMRNIYLARLSSGEILCVVPDGVDYSKGLAWTNSSASIRGGGIPEFVTYGRHGTINRYRLVNEKIHPWGRFQMEDAIVLPKYPQADQVTLGRQTNLACGCG